VGLRESARCVRAGFTWPGMNDGQNQPHNEDVIATEKWTFMPNKAYECCATIPN
jgi:hypothetical protein